MNVSIPSIQARDRTAYDNALSPELTLTGIHRNLFISDPMTLPRYSNTFSTIFC